jgi:RNA polymerase sigma-70 factor (sigma-E family)
VAAGEQVAIRDRVPAGELADYVRLRGAALLRMALSLTGNNRADAEDLVQVALIKTYLSMHRVTDPAALDAYVRRVMVNAHISRWRRRRVDEYPVGELPDGPAAGQAPDCELHEALRQAVDRLPRRMRAAVLLRYFDDLPEPEVAAALGVSVGTVKSTVARAVAKLRADAGLAAAGDLVTGGLR